MPKVNYPNTSFINLFNAIIYDSNQNPNYSLDIWDAYIILTDYKKDLVNFQLYNVAKGDTWIKLANTFYNDQRLWWIIPLFNQIDDPFIIKQQDILDKNVTQLKILTKNNVDQMLFDARRKKIINDSSLG